MKTVIIVAMREDRLIGREGRLPWHVPADLRHFKETTLGHAIIMGRRTFESCGRPLPGRRNIVLTRDPAWSPPPAQNGSADAGPGGPVFTGNVTQDRAPQTTLDVVGSLDEALELCRRRGEATAFIVGGAQVYQQALPIADEMIVTYIDAPDAAGAGRAAVATGDTYFPEWDSSAWTASAYRGDPSLRIVQYRRRTPA